MLHATPLITAMLTGFAVLIGLVMGSFLNCLALRLTTGETIMGRSHCFSCAHELSGADLVPLFSYIFLGGKCRYCHAKIPLRYPLTEACCALIYAALLYRFDFSWELLKFTLLFSVLFSASLADLQEYIIPDPLVIAGIVCRIPFIFLSPAPGKEALNALLGGFSVALLLLLIVLISEKVMKKEAMGGGDIKLFFMIGLYFNWKVNLFLLLCSCLIGILFAAVFGKGKGKMIPFGPSIACAALVAALCGEKVIAAYLGLFAR